MTENNAVRLGGNSGEMLRAYVERVERMEEEKKAIAEDIREIFAEAKSNGFDAKALRTIVRIRKMDPEKRKQEQDVLDTYMHALGLI